MSTLVVSPAYQQPISLIVFILVLLLQAQRTICPWGDRWPLIGRRRSAAQPSWPFSLRAPRFGPGQPRHERHGDPLHLRHSRPRLEPHRGLHGAGEPRHRGLLRREHHGHPLPLESRPAHLTWRFPPGPFLPWFSPCSSACPRCASGACISRSGPSPLPRRPDHSGQYLHEAGFHARAASPPTTASLPATIWDCPWLRRSMVVVYVVARSKMGLAMVAIRDDEEAAQGNGREGLQVQGDSPHDQRRPGRTGRRPLWLRPPFLLADLVRLQPLVDIRCPALGCRWRGGHPVRTG